MSADSNETPKSNSSEQADSIATIKSDLDSKLSEVQQQLAQMNEFMQSQQRAAAKPQATEIDDSDVFDAQSLNRKVTQAADSVARELLAQERQKNATIYQMAQEYPEIHSDKDLQKEILSAQKTLPKSLQDTAEGYEMAVLKAVSKQGLVAKSRRQAASSDDDFSVGSRSSSSTKSEGRRSSGKKVSEATLAAAELLRGRALTDEERKGLEQAASRDTYNRYR
jgi:hypothetical protein